MNPLKLQTICLLKCRNDPYKTELYNYFNKHDVDNKTFKLIFEYINIRAYSIEGLNLILSNRENTKLALITDYIKLVHIPEEYITRELILLSVKKQLSNILDIPKKFFTQELINDIIKLDSRNKKFINKLSNTKDIYAVKRNSFALSIGIIQTDEIRKIAVKKNGLAIMLLTDVEHDMDYHFNMLIDFRPEIYKLAVTNFGVAISYIHKWYLTKDICEAAIKNCKLSICCIHHIVLKEYKIHNYSDEYKFTENEITDALLMISEKPRKYAGFKDCDLNMRKIFFRRLYEVCVYKSTFLDEEIIKDDSFLDKMAKLYPPIYEEYY